MNASSPAVPKNLRYSNARFEQTVLLLQGGGALGSYQAGVYQALAEANLHPDWVAGISIGAVNSALIAGNPPEKRVERLREFWEAVSRSINETELFRQKYRAGCRWNGCSGTCLHARAQRVHPVASS
jgi:predicted acylesterase/phospholipase RssA